jgi:hypothetical protein
MAVAMSRERYIKKNENRQAVAPSEALTLFPAFPCSYHPKLLNRLRLLAPTETHSKHPSWPRVSGPL